MSHRPDSSHAHYQQAREAMQARDWPAALKGFRASLRELPHFKTCELLGECLLESEEPAEALIYLAAAVGLGTNAFRARFLMAKAFLALGERNEARRSLQSAIEMKPDYKSARQLLDEIRRGTAKPYDR